MKTKSAALITITALCCMILSSCSNSAPLSLFATETPTPTSTSTSTPTPTPTATPLPTPTAIGGGKGLIYVSHMQNFTTWAEGYNSGIRSDCFYDVFDTSGRRQYELTDCYSGDYSSDVMFTDNPHIAYSWSGDPEDDTRNPCFFGTCYSSEELGLSDVINRQTMEENGHQFYSYRLPGSSDSKILFLDSYDGVRDQVDIYVIDLDQKESRLLIEGADLSHYTWIPNYNLSPDGKWIIYEKSEPEEQTFITAIDGSSTRSFIERPLYSKLPIWSADSSSLFMFSTSQDGYQTGIFTQQVIRVDLVTLESEVIVEGDSIFGSQTITPGREECFFSSQAEILYCGSFMVDMTQSPVVVRPLIQEAFERQGTLYLSYTYSPDQSRVIYSVEDTNVDEPYLGYFVMDVKTGKYRKFDDFAFVGSWSPDGRLVLAYDKGLYDKGERNLYVVDTENMHLLTTIPQGTDPIGDLQWIP